jgi:regulator of sirC expression with transglutaminase-like and TPR domain
MENRILTLLFLPLALYLLWYRPSALQAASETQDTIDFNRWDVLNNEKFQLSEKLLELSLLGSREILHEDFLIAQYQNQLKQMAQELRRLMRNVRSPQERLAVMNDYFFKTEQFRVDRSRLFESDPNAFLLNKVLDRKHGSCLGLSLLYLLMSEDLDLPIDGVVVPNHFFVRYNDGKKQWNIEATQEGTILGQDYYVRNFFYGYIDENALRCLTKREVLGIYVSNLANEIKLKGFHERALELLEIANRLFPGQPSIITNLGNVYERLGRIGQAITQYQIAIEKAPYLCEAYYNLGLAHFLYTGNSQLARKYGEIALKMGCRMHPRFKAFLLSHEK